MAAVVFHTNVFTRAVTQCHGQVAEHGLGFALVGLFGNLAFDAADECQQRFIVQIRVVKIVDVDTPVFERDAGDVRHAVVGGFAVGRAPFVGVASHHLDCRMQGAYLDRFDLVDVFDEGARFECRLHH